MPPDPFSAFLLGFGIHPEAFVMALILSSGVTAVIACLILKDDTPRRS